MDKSNNVYKFCGKILNWKKIQERYAVFIDGVYLTL